MKNILLIVIVLAAKTVTFAQCYEYYLSYHCRPTPFEAKDMNLSSQSKSAYIEAYKTYSFQMTLFRKMDYRIIFCAVERFYPVHYVLKDKNTGMVLFDNQTDEYVQSFSVSVEETIPVIAEVTLLANKAEFKDLRKDRTCLGIGIMYRRIPKMGFE